jgi:hypothetical protein
VEREEDGYIAWSFSDIASLGIILGEPKLVGVPEKERFWESLQIAPKKT